LGLHFGLLGHFKRIVNVNAKVPYGTLERLHFGLLGHFKRIVNVNAKVPYGTLELRMPQQELHSPDFFVLL
jgi:hypothetical protein